GRPITYRLTYKEGSAAGRAAARYLAYVLHEANVRELLRVQVGLRTRVQAAKGRLDGFPLIHPVRVESAVLPNPRRAPLPPLPVSAPPLLTRMPTPGPASPAIAPPAGERERGTLEILVAAPTPRLGVLFAKYVAVLPVAALPALVNVTAMTL